MKKCYFSLIFNIYTIRVTPLTSLPRKEVMNGYAKRILVLKNTAALFSDDCRPLKGVATVSQSDNGTDIELCVYNLDTEAAKEILAVIYIYGNFYSFNVAAKKRVMLRIEKSSDLSGKILILPQLSDGTTLGYAAVSGGELLIKEGELYAKKTHGAQGEIVRKEPPSDELFVEKSSGEHAYDDDRIATENYYRLDDAKLIYEKNERAQNSDCEETKKSENSGYAYFDEENFNAYKSENYYLSVKRKIDDLLSSNPAESELNGAVPGGKFAAIAYDKIRRYAIGTIEERGAIKYVCYGIPVTRKEPAPQLKNAKFIPLDMFDLSGRGYYLVFKDAASGKSV